MYCSNCGAQLPNGVKFCSECGLAIQQGKVASEVDAPKSGRKASDVRRKGIWRDINMPNQIDNEDWYLLGATCILLISLILPVWPDVYIDALALSYTKSPTTVTLFVTSYRIFMVAMVSALALSIITIRRLYKGEKTRGLYWIILAVLLLIFPILEIKFFPGGIPPFMYILLVLSVLFFVFGLKKELKWRTNFDE